MIEVNNVLSLIAVLATITFCLIVVVAMFCYIAQRIEARRDNDDKYWH